MLQVVFLAELARADKRFGPDDVVATIVDKLVRRHPHVFGDTEVDSAAEVLGNWERIKAAERRERGDESGVLGGVPRSLPSLVRAQRVGEKAGNVGFDWPDKSGPRSKLDEELRELDEAIAAGDKPGVEAELGDVLFALVNMARHLEIDADLALRRTIDKFTRRFVHVERRVDEHHGGFAEVATGEVLPLEQLDAYWHEAKTMQDDDG